MTLPTVLPSTAPGFAGHSAQITPGQIRAARVALNWTCNELVVKAGLVRRTVWRSKTGKTPKLNAQRSNLPNP